MSPLSTWACLGELVKSQRRNHAIWGHCPQREDHPVSFICLAGPQPPTTHACGTWECAQKHSCSEGWRSVRAEGPRSPPSASGPPTASPSLDVKPVLGLKTVPRLLGVMSPQWMETDRPWGCACHLKGSHSLSVTSVDLRGRAGQCLCSPTFGAVSA